MTYFNIFINFSYLISSILFIFGLKLLTKPTTARFGNLLSSTGMLLAILVTLVNRQIIDYYWIIGALIIGTLIGLFAAKKVLMTQMPEMVALLNGFGGGASLLVGTVIFKSSSNFSLYTLITIFLSVLIGGVTFSGSLLAWAKLNEKFKLISSKAQIFSFQKFLNFFILASLVTLGVLFCIFTKNLYFFPLIIILSLILGYTSVAPIGGADMPVVISLLNSYSGIAATFCGLIINNNLLIIAGILVGASGVILTTIMCKAMNRSLINVLFSGFGSAKQQSLGNFEKKSYRSVTPEDVYFTLEAAKSVVIVPGYGMAVAQAQHVLKELAKVLEDNGADVKFAIHPVAGRMPGHMNVLLAEADISYDKLFEMDDINAIMNDVDVVLVIGANDVVNTSARDDKTSSIYGMPIIEVDRAKNVFILKRSMSSGFAGIENPIFFNENSSMVFGDAKTTLQAILSEF